MKRHSTSGIAFGLRLADAIGGARVLTVPKSQMFRTLLRVSMFAIGASVLLLAASPARAIFFDSYVFKEIANTRGQFSQFGSATINNDGTIAVVARLDAGGEQVLTQSTIVADTTSNFINFGFGIGAASINNNGLVVFFGQTSDGTEGIFAKSADGVFTTIADDSGSLSIEGNAISRVISRQFDVNDNGDVLFRALLESDRDGIYQRNAAGGPFITRTEENDDGFGFAAPVINNNETIAFQKFFTDSNSTAQRHQIRISPGGLVLDTDDGYEVRFENIDISDSNRIVYTAEDESGVSGVYTAVKPNPLITAITTVVDTSGPFELVDDPAINSNDVTAFFGSLDLGGGRGLFSGPNPVNNKIIAVGDVLQIANRTIVVSSLDLGGSFGTGSLNDRGQHVFTFRDQTGVQYLFQARSFLSELLENIQVAQLSTAMDEKRTMMQTFTFPSFSPTQLTFDYRFLTPGAELVAYINDIEVGRVIRRSTEPMDEFDTKVIPINPLALFGEILPDLLTLKLEIGDGPGTTVQLDNIVFTDIVNGDFATGDFTGWQFDGGEGAAIVTNGLDLIFVPEPATSALALLNLFALILAFGRRRH